MTLTIFLSVAAIFLSMMAMAFVTFGFHELGQLFGSGAIASSVLSFFHLFTE